MLGMVMCSSLLQLVETGTHDGHGFEPDLSIGIMDGELSGLELLVLHHGHDALPVADHR